MTLLLVIALIRASHREITDSLFVSDGFGYYIYLPSLVLDHDLDLTNQILHQPTQVRHWTFETVARTGKPGNVFQIGPTLLWLPFFATAHALLNLLNLMGMRVPLTGFGWNYELPVYCGSFLYGLLGIWYIWRLLKEHWGYRIATGSTLLTVLATPVAAYLWFEPDMSHILSMALISMLFYYLHKANASGSSLRLWAGLGILVGLIGLIRVPDLAVGISIAWVVMTSLITRAKESTTFVWHEVISQLTVLTLAACLAFVPQLLVWKVLYGNMFSMPPNPFYTQMRWTHPDLLHYLFSTLHGMFSWTPILFAATIGVVWGAIRGPVVMRWSLSVLLVAVYFNSSIYQWWAGASFGERRIVDYAILFALGLGYLFSLRPTLLSKCWVYIGFLGICTFNWILMVRYFIHDLPEYGYVSWHNLYITTLSYPLRLFIH